MDLRATASGVPGQRVPNPASEDPNCDQENACILLKQEDNVLALRKIKKLAIPASASNGIHGRSGQHARIRQTAAAMERNFDREIAPAKWDNQAARETLLKKLIALHERASGPIGNAQAPVPPLAAKDEQHFRAHASKKASVKVWQRQRGLVSTRNALDGSPGRSGASARSRVEADVKRKREHAMDSFTLTAAALWSKSWLAMPALAPMECFLALHLPSVVSMVLEAIRTTATETTI